MIIIIFFTRLFNPIKLEVSYASKRIHIISLEEIPPKNIFSPLRLPYFVLFLHSITAHISLVIDLKAGDLEHGSAYHELLAPNYFLQSVYCMFVFLTLLKGCIQGEMMMNITTKSEIFFLNNMPLKLPLQRTATNENLNACCYLRAFFVAKFFASLAAFLYMSL